MDSIAGQSQSFFVLYVSSFSLSVFVSFFRSKDIWPKLLCLLFAQLIKLTTTLTMPGAVVKQMNNNYWCWSWWWLNNIVKSQCVRVHVYVCVCVRQREREFIVKWQCHVDKRVGWIKFSLINNKAPQSITAYNYITTPALGNKKHTHTSTCIL